MQGVIEEIYIAPTGGADMQRINEVEALCGRGLAADRYCEGAGYWSGVDECQVTLIEAEDIEAIRMETGIQITRGQHRRNLITRNIRLGELAGKQFEVGAVVLEYDRPRPPCNYIQSITEPGMTKALLHRGGVCARVVKSGRIRVGDSIVIL